MDCAGTTVPIISRKKTGRGRFDISQVRLPSVVPSMSQHDVESSRMGKSNPSSLVPSVPRGPVRGDLAASTARRTASHRARSHSTSRPNYPLTQVLAASAGTCPSRGQPAAGAVATAPRTRRAAARSPCSARVAAANAGWSTEQGLSVLNAYLRTGDCSKLSVGNGSCICPFPPRGEFARTSKEFT